MRAALRDIALTAQPCAGGIPRNPDKPVDRLPRVLPETHCRCCVHSLFPRAQSL
tara:strand:- start:735 stop:896 length:162 start_codon:yes stop_codon:yes gene_type:complete